MQTADFSALTAESTWGLQESLMCVLGKEGASLKKTDEVSPAFLETLHP